VVTGASPVILFCALESEFAAVRKRLPAGKQVTHGVLPTYYATKLESRSGRKRSVVVVQTGVASVKAGITAARILGYFDNPEIIVLLGITAGLKSKDVKLGDVLVPTATVDVESGKVTPKGKEPAGLSYEMSLDKQKAIAQWPGQGNWSKRWGKKRPVKTKGRSKVIADCTIACTSSVIAYDKRAQALRLIHRKISGVEMEALGIAMASQLVGRPFVIVKSISDWADRQKKNKWHAYCMASAADIGHFDAGRRNIVRSIVFVLGQTG
jgi:nucleoside phosphorylase